MLGPGATFDRYRIEALLGRGMGAVYRAWDERLGRRVALKVLGPAATGEPLDDDDRDAILSEARLAARLRHANVVTIYDVGETEGSVYLTMELVSGSSLRDRMRGGPVGTSEVVQWLAGIASALRAAHLEGILHRDVKPENVIVCDDGTIKLLDFGIAKSESSAAKSVRAGHVLGTPHYMAPEQILGLPLDPACDQFAWGVVAYELLAGRPPWSGARSSAALDRGVAVPLDRVAPKVPAAAVAVVMRALASDKRGRFASVEQAARALEGALGSPSR